MGYVVFMPRIFITHCYLWVQTDPRMSLFRNSSMWSKNCLREYSLFFFFFFWWEVIDLVLKWWENQLMSLDESFGQRCTWMIDGKWDSFHETLCSQFIIMQKFFFFSLNSSLNSLKLYFPLIHSRLAGKNGLLGYKLLPVLALKVVQDGWSPRAVALGWRWLVHLPWYHTTIFM